MIEQAMGWITTYGYGAIFVLLAVGIMGLPVPDEVLLTFIGYLASRGTLALAGVFAAGLAGAYAGIFGSFFIGRLAGVWLIEKHGKWFGLDRPAVDRVEAWLERYGKWTIVFGFYVPGVRHVTAFSAGVAKMPPSHFAPYALSGASLWASIFILAGYFLGEEWRKAPRALEAATPWVVAGVLLGAGIAGLVWWRHRRREPAADPAQKVVQPPPPPPPPGA